MTNNDETNVFDLPENTVGEIINKIESLAEEIQYDRDNEYDWSGVIIRLSGKLREKLEEDNIKLFINLED
jgi:hypothetical protein